jgi:hypothetical protein
VPNIKKYPNSITMPLYFEIDKGILKINEGSYIAIDNATKINFYAIIDALSSQMAITAKVDSQYINIDDYIILKTDKPLEGNDLPTEAKPSNNLLNSLPKESISIFDTRKMAIDFQVDIQKLIAYNITTQQVYANLKARNGTIVCTTKADVFSGKVSADIKAKESASVVDTIDISASLSNIESQSVITAFNIPQVAQGKVNASISISANESSPYAIMSRGKGEINFDVSNLMVKGIDIDSIASDLQTDYKKILTGGVAKYLSPMKKSAIDQIIFQSTLKNGVIDNHKLFAQRRKITLNGNGTIKLLNSDLKYRLNIFSNSQPLPSVILDGKVSDISYSIDPKPFIVHHTKKILSSQSQGRKLQEKLNRFKSVIDNFKR